MICMRKATVLHSLNLEPFIDMIDIHFIGVKLMRLCDILWYYITLGYYMTKKKLAEVLVVDAEYRVLLSPRIYTAEIST